MKTLLQRSSRLTRRQRRAGKGEPSLRRPRALAVSLSRFSSGFAMAAAMAGALLAGSGEARAATYYWDSDATGLNNVLTGGGLGGLGLWDTTSARFWNGGPSLVDQAWSNASFDTAVFTGTAGIVTIPSGITVGGLQFNTTGYQLGVAGNTLTFGANSNITLDNIAAANITANLAGTGNINVTGGAFAGLTAGTLTLAGTGAAFTGTTTIGNSMTVTLTGATATALSNTTGITLSTGGFLNDVNTVTDVGITKIAAAPITGNGGTLTYNNTAGAINYAASFGSLTAASGQTVVVSTNATNAGSTEVLTLANLANSGTGTLSLVGGGGLNTTTNQILVTGKTATTAGQIIGPWLTTGTAANALTDYAVYNASGQVVAANVAASVETAWTTATNSFNFTAAQTLTGTRTINSLRYSGTGGTILTVGTGFNLNTVGILQTGSTATASIAATGTGNISTPAGGGNLYLTGGTAFGLIITAPIVDNGGNVTTVISTTNIITLSGTNTYSGGTVLNSGTLAIGASANLGDPAGGLTVNGNSTLSLSAAFTLPATRLVTLNNGAISTINNATNAATIAGNITGTGGIIYGGTGTLTLSGTNNFTGPLSLTTGGTVQAGSTSAFGSNSAVVFSNTAGEVLNTTGFNNAVGSISGGGTTGGNITLGTAILTVGGNNENTTFAGVIGVGGTAGGLTKVGSGILTLTGTNLYTGNTNLNGGLINITALANLGTSGVAFNGGGLQFAAPGVDPSVRNLTFAAGGATIDTNGSQIFFANAVGNGGTGSLTKNGLGVLYLQGNNTYTGATVVNAGVLNLQNAGALGAGTAGVTVNSGATLALAGAGLNFGTQTLTLNGNGAATGLSNGALVNVSGSNTYGGALVLGSASTISVDNASTLNLSSGSNVTGSGDLTLTGTGSGTLLGSLTEAGGLNKTGSGTWTLSGTAGSYTGATSITGGTLNFVGGALGATSGTTLGGGAISLTSGNQSLGNLTLTAGTRNTVTVGAASTLAVGGTAIARGTGATVFFNESSGGTVSATTIVGSGTNNLLGYAQVNDGTATGLAYINASGNIARLDTTNGALVSVLADNSATSTTDYTTNGMAANPLLWSNGITTRSVNSLSFDTSGAGAAQTVNMGAVGNILTLSSGALQTTATSTFASTLQGGQIGAANSEVIVHLNGSGALNLNSPISSGTGSLLIDGVGLAQLTGGLSTLTGTLNGSTTVTVSSTAGLSVGQAVTGGGIAAGTTIASITNGTTLVLSTAATASMPSPLTFGTGSTYTGATTLNGGTVKAGAATLTAPGAFGNNLLGQPTIGGGPFGINSAVTLGSGSTLDLNGFNTIVGSVAGAGNIALSNGATLTIGGLNFEGNIANTNVRTTVAGQITGSGNLTLTGGGSVTLTNNTNNFTGQVNIPSGTLVVSNMGQLGSASLVAVEGFTSTAGLPGGTLIVQGGGGTTGLTFDRNLSFSGRGASSVGAALINIGNNTYTAPISTSSNTEDRFGSVAGTMTLNGTVNLGIGANAFYHTYGIGNVVINGLLTGGLGGTLGVYQNVSSSEVLLTNYNNTQVGDLRLDNGFVRLSNGGEIGLNSTVNALRGAGGAWDIRTDAPASFAGHTVSLADGNQSYFVDRAAGGAGLGTQTVSAAGVPSYVSAAGNVTLGNFIANANADRTLTITGRDGYGASFTSLAGSLSNANTSSYAVTNSSNGVVTLDGTFTLSSDGTTRAFTLQGNGDTLDTGYLRQTSGVTKWVKAGNGTVTLTGVNTTVTSNSTYTAGTNINAGTLLLSGASATIGNASGGLLNGVAGGALQIGSGGTFGAFDYRGAGETTAKTINLQGSTGAGIILANETGATPLVFNTSAVGASGGGIKNFYLGGSSTLANEIAGVIDDNTTTNKTSLVKFGTGTWLYDPAAGTYTAGNATVPWVSGGGQNAITFTVAANTTGIAVGETVSGDNTSGVVTAWNPATGLVTISNSIGTAMVAGNVAFSANANFTGAVSVTGGTLQVKPTAPSGVSGGNLFTTAQNLVFSADTGISNGAAGGTFELATPTVAFTANLSQTMGALTATAGHGRVQVDSGNSTFSNILSFNTFGARAAGATLNFAPASTLAGIQFVTPPAGLGGIIGGFAYITDPVAGGIDFAATPAANTNVAALNGFLSTNTLPAATGSATTNYQNNASLTLTAPTLANAIRIIGTGQTIAQAGFALTLTNTSAVATGGLLFDNSGGAATISGGNIAGSAATELILIAGGTAPANLLTINSTLGLGTANAVTKAGTGTIVIGGANTFTGNLTINEGKIQMAAGSTTATLGTTTTAANVTTIRQGATLDVNNAGANVAPFTGATALNTTNIGVLAGAGAVDNSSATASAIALGNAASTGLQNFSGIISNSGGGALTVIKNGTSASWQALTGLNTYTGATVINTGNLQVNSLANGGTASSIGASSNAAGNLVFNGGTLQYTGDTATNTNIYQTTQTPSVSTDRLFTLQGNATIDSSGTFGNVVAAARVANSAALVFSNTGAIVYSTTGNKTLTLQGDSAGDNQINLQLVDPGSGALSVTKTNAGLWILGNPGLGVLGNTYSGATTITQGILRAQDSGSLATGATVVANGTTTTDFNVTSTAGLAVGQAVTGGGTGTIAAILDGTHVRLSSAQTLAAGTALTFSGFNSLSANSNLVFNQATGGTEAELEMAGTFTRTIGTAAGQVSWATNASGGFAASSSPLTVTLGGSASFGTGSGFIGNGTGQLYLNSTTALSDVTLSANLSLNGGVRTVNVLDNTTTTTDYATLSGVISGGTGSGLTRAGVGTLYITGANTYSGNTTLNSSATATTIVRSIGGGSTASSAFGDGSGILTLSGTTPVLLYVGGGETASRQINLATSGTISNSGSGALVITNLVNSAAGAKTLTLGGFSSDANTLTSVLADNGGAMSVTKADGGTWILTGANTYSGGTTVSQGWLGIAGSTTGGLGTPTGTGGIAMTNSGLFASTANLTINNQVTFNNNATEGFTGNFSINLVGSLSATPIVLPTGNNWGIMNTIAAPAALTFSGAITTNVAANQDLIINGTGNTIFNTPFVSVQSGAGLVRLNVNSIGTVTLNNAETLNTQGAILNEGTLVLGAANALNAGTPTAVTLLVMPAGTLQSGNSTFTTGGNALTAPLQLTNIFGVISGTGSIEFAGNATAGFSLQNNGNNRAVTNSLTGGASLTFSTQPVALSSDSTSRQLTLQGAGTTNISSPIINGSTSTAGLFVFSGTGALNLTGLSTFAGAATFNGGTTTVSGAGVLGSTATLTENNGAILTLDNNIGVNTANRLGGRALTINGATLNINSNASTVTTETSAGALTLGSGQSVINLVNNGGGNALTFGTFGTPAAGSTVDFTGGVGVAANKVLISGTAPVLSPVTTGILARATVAGTDWATYDATLGFKAFASYVTPADVNALAATDTAKVTSTTTTKTFAPTSALPATKTINALAFNDATGFAVTSTSGYTLALTSGGIFSQLGANTLGGRIAFGAVEGVVQVAAGSSLNLSGSVVTGSVGLTKGLSGNLTISGPQFYSAGTTTLNGGTTNLTFGLNTLFPNLALTVNQGAVLDLNANAQYVGLFSSGGGAIPGAGGTVQSTGGTGTLVTSMSGNGTWSGSINGAVNFSRINTNTLTFQSPNAYTGKTELMGGITTLRDNATLSNTSQINISYGTLTIDNNADLAIDNNNRVNDAAAINLRGGTITFNGRANSTSSETLGAVTVVEGASVLTSSVNNVGTYATADLILSGLTRTPNNGATLNFTTASGFLGADGTNPRILVNSGLTNLASGAIGGWAIANSTDFAGYNPAQGVGALNSAGYQGYTGGYSSGGALFGFGANLVTNLLAGANLVTDVPGAGTTSTGMLRLAGSFTNDLTFSGGGTLDLIDGGLLRSNVAFTSTIGTTASRGTLTSGLASATSTTSELDVYNAGSQVTINSVVANNGGTGNKTIFVKSGGGTVLLTAANSFSGGTIVDQGTLTLTATAGAGTVVLPAGGLTINGGVQGTGATVNSTLAGQLDVSTDVILNGRATLTLTGNNTLSSLTFFDTGSDTGAPTVTPTGILTLSSATPVSVPSISNAAFTPIVSGGTLALTAATSTLNVAAIQAVGSVTYSAITPSLTISSAITGSSAISKTGAGLLLLSGPSTFTGNLTVSNGGIIIGVSSSPTAGTTGQLLTSPLGLGSVSMAAGTSLLTNNASFAVGNNIAFGNGTPTFDTTGNAASQVLTLNGALSFNAATALAFSIPNPNLTVSLLGPITGIGSITSITRTGLGVLNFNSAGYTGNFNVSSLGAPGAITIFNDGDGFGDAQTITLGNVVFDAGVIPGITIQRAGSTLPLTLAANKILAVGSVNNIGLGLTLTNSNGYGLSVPDSATLTGTPTFSVSAASGSNVTQGLTLTGVLGGTGFIKSGAGALVLGNSGNTFAGSINIQQGIVSAATDGALGAAANGVLLNVNAATAAGFRATGTFATSRAFTLNQVSNAFEVTVGNVLTLNTALTIPTLTNGLFKNDNGVLELAAANPSGWTGGITINAGAVRFSNSAAAGSASNVITVANNGNGAAIQLANGVNIPNALTLTSGGSLFVGGINSAGQLESVSGNNTWSGAINFLQDSSFGADAGATLNFTGGIAQGGHLLSLAGAGNINFTTTPITGVYQITKYGSGTTNISVNVGAPVNSGPVIDAGTLILSGAAGALANGTKATVINPGGTLTLDDTTTVNTARLGSNPVNFFGGNLNYLGNSSGTSAETVAAAPNFQRGFSVITVNAGSGQQANLLFTSSSNVAANAQNNSTGPTGTSVLFRGTSLGSAAGANVATIIDSGSTNGFAFNGATGATGTTTKGIIPWGLLETSVSGTGATAQFATGDAASAALGTTTLLRQLNTSTEMATNTAFATNVNERLTANQAVAATVVVNSLTLESGGQVTINPVIPLNISSGGILAKTGNAGISGGVISQTAGFSPLQVWAVGDLTVSSLLNGGNGVTNAAVGFVKAGAGTLTLSTPLSTLPGLGAMSANSYSGQMVINQGTLKLNGGKNTIFANNFLEVGLGGTLDLNGTSQQTWDLFTDGVVNGAGGTITSSSGVGNLVVNEGSANRNWAGNIAGGTVASGNYVNFTHSGAANTMTIYSPQTYSGSTLINGGTVTLRDSGSLANTASIDINYATLSADNNASTSASDLPDFRINNTAPITLRGGTLNFQGRAQTASNETVGTVTLAQGSATINSVIGGTGINSADLTLGGLVRSAGGGIVNFTAVTGGLIGSSSRIFTPTINGVSTATSFGGLTNGIIGGWAVIGTADWATYVPGLGIAAMGAVGAPQYAAAVTVSSTSLATDNIKLSTGASTITLDTTINSLATSNVAVGTVSIAAGKTLTLATGGLLSFTGSAWNLGSAPNVGNLTSGGPELFDYVQTGGSASPVINAVITGNITLVKGGSGSSTLAATNTYTGGTTVSQGILNVATTSLIPLATVPANGLVINNATVNFNAPGGIAAGNLVTLNGGSPVLNLFGNNTLTGVVFNDNGGSGIPVINTFTTTSTLGAGGATGVLTIGASGIVVTSSNTNTIPSIEGRVDFGTSANTINVGTIDANGATDISPLLAAFALRGVIASTGGITKTGNGVLQLNAQEVFTGPLTVSAGGLKVGVTNGGSRYSALTLNAGTRFDLNGLGTTFGSLAGAGTVFNSNVTTSTLTVGLDGTTTTFSGQISRFNDGNLNGIGLTKIGGGILNMTGVQTAAAGSTGTVTVNGGTISFNGSGAWFPGTVTPPMSGTFTVNPGGILALDNSIGANVSNRLGLNAAGTLNLQGGQLAVIGNSGATTAESIATFNVLNGGGRVTLSPNAASPLNLTIGTLSNLNGNGTALFQGLAGTAAGNGNATLTITNAPSLTGAQGAGLNGSSNMSIRQDILADASGTGLGTGFLVKDTTTNLYRALGGAAGIASTEYNLVPATWATAQNAGINGSAQTVTGNATANTLTVGGTTSSLGSSLNATAFGSFGPSGLLSLSTNTSAALVLNGSTFTNNLAFNGATLTTTLAVHTVGTAVFNQAGFFGLNSTGGLIKADDGTLNLNNLAFFTGGLVVNGGTVGLGSGSDNTLAVVPGATTPVLNALALNGVSGVLDLKGNSQAVGNISSINILPGQGGTIVNSGAGTATVTTTGGNFGGQIGGGTVLSPVNNNIALTRAGTTTTLLTNASTYGGATTIRGGTLQLRDSGSILNTSSIAVNYGGTLLVDNFGLNPVGTPNPTRVAAATPVTLLGGVVTLNGAGSTDNTLTINTLNVSGGGNSVNVLPQINEGSTALITIGNLVRSATNHSTVNFNGFTTNNSTGVSTTGGQGFTVNGNIILNQINGVTFNAAALTNNLIGGWAVADGNTFATYVNGAGVSVMAQTTGSIAAPGFDAGTLISATTATQNISDSTTYSAANPLASGAHVANSWRLVPGATSTLTMSTGATLSLGVGIISNANLAVGIQGTDATNTLTSPNADLYVFVNQSTTSINTKITGAIDFVKTGGATLGLGSATTPANNDYTLGTFVQAGTLTLNGASGSTIIPAGPAGAGLVINNATVTQNTNAQQIAATTDVVINGGGALNLTIGANTLNSVTFNNQGGTGNPTVAVGASTLTLSGTNPITVTNDSLSNTPLISGGTGLIFTAAPTITTSGLSPDELNISTVITSAGGVITKAGAGSLTLSGVNTFTTGFDLNQGSLIFGVATVGTPPTITSGPVGTGTLQIDNGTSIMSDGTARTIGNAITVTGNFAFGGQNSGNNVTLTGAINLGAAARTMTVGSPAVTAAINSLLTSTAGAGVNGLTKAGPGVLTIGVAQTDVAFGGAGITVSGGVLKSGVANALPVSSLITVNAGAEFDLNAFGQISKQIAGGGVITDSGAAVTFVIGGTSAADVTTNLSSTFNGSITNAAAALSLTKAGLGGVTLGGPSTYTGPTAINAGAFNVLGSIGATAVSVSGGASLGGSGNGTTTGVIGLTTSATGGTVTVAAGATAATQGSIDLRDAATGTLTIAGNNLGAASTTLTLGGTAGNTSVLDFDLGSTSTDKLAVLQKAVVNAGGAIINLNQLSGSTLLPGTYSLVSYAGQTLTGAYTAGTGFTGGPFTYALANTATSENLVVTAAALNTAYWKGDKSSVWTTFSTVTGATNWYTDNTAATNSFNTPGPTTNVFFTVDSGATSLTNTLGVDTSIKSLTFTGTGTSATAGVTIGGNTLTLGTGGLTVQSGSGADTINSNVVLGSSQTWANNSASTLTIGGSVTNGSSLLTVGGSGNTTINGALGSGAGGLTMSGTGTLTLGGASTYTGATNVTAGTLALAGSLSGTTNVNVSHSATFSVAATASIVPVALVNSGLVVFSNSAATVGSLSGTDSTSTVSLLGPTALTINASGAYAGAIGGTGGSLTIAGGTQTLTGLNGYTGGTSIGSGATLQLGDGVTDGNLTATSGISNNGALLFNRTGTVTTVAAITGSGSVAVLGTGTEILVGLSSFNGPTTIAANSILQLGNGAADGNLTATSGIANNGTLIYRPATSVTTSAQITGNGSLVVNGTGTVALTGNNQYLGGTVINGGTVQINSATSLGASSGLATVNNATVEATQTFTSGRAYSLGDANSTLAVDAGKTFTLNGNINGSGALNVTGPGILALGGSNSYTGPTNIKSGTLAALASGSISGNINITSGASFDVTALGSGYTLPSSRTLTTVGASPATVTGTLTGATSSTVSPGGTNALGNLAVTGGLTLSGTFAADLAPGASDLITTPSLTLSGATLSLGLINGFQPGGDGSLYTLINNTGASAISGIFAGTVPMSFGSAFGGQTFDTVQAPDGEYFAVSYTGEGGAFTAAGGNDVVLMAVPEPSAVGSLLAGLASLAGLQRFRRRSARSAR